MELLQDKVEKLSSFAMEVLMWEFQVIYSMYEAYTEWWPSG